MFPEPDNAEVAMVDKNAIAISSLYSVLRLVLGKEISRTGFLLSSSMNEPICSFVQPKYTPVTGVLDDGTTRRANT